MAADTHADPFRESAPTVTDHAARRWDERTSPESVSPETGWLEATRIDTGHSGHGSDEFRVHEGEAVVLVRSDCVITTVYDLTGSDASPGMQSAVYAAVGPVWMDDPVATQSLDDRGAAPVHEVAWFFLAVFVAVAGIALAGVLL